MNVWIDQQISPYMVGWLEERFGLDVEHVRDLGLHEAEDPDVFEAARQANVVVGRASPGALGEEGRAPLRFVASAKTFSELLEDLISRNRLRFASPDLFEAPLELGPYLVPLGG